MNEPPKFSIPSKADLRALIISQIPFIRGQLDKHKTSFRPMLLVQCLARPDGHEENVVSIIASGYNEHKEKLAAISTLARAISERALAPISVVLMAEMWVAINSPAGVMPRDCPDRQECIGCFGLTVAKDAVLISIPVSRNNQKEMMVAGPPNEYKDMEVRVPILDHFFSEWFRFSIERIATPGRYSE
jgi:hypothetical protein